MGHTGLVGSLMKKKKKPHREETKKLSILNPSPPSKGLGFIALNLFQIQMPVTVFAQDMPKTNMQSFKGWSSFTSREIQVFPLA